MLLFLISVAVSCIVVLLTLCYSILTWHYGYWEKRNVPTVKPFPGFGNMKDAFFMKRHMCDIYTELYKKFDGYLYCGVYNMRKPALMIRDPDLVRDVLVKNFNSFQNNDIYLDEKVDPYGSKNPFVSKGEEWRTRRTFLSPIFTSGRIKAMFPTMMQVGDKLVEYLKSDPDATSATGLSVKEVAAKYTTDVTAMCGFGIDAKSFTSTNPEFREMGRKILDGGTLNTLKLMITMVFQELATILRIKFFSTEVINFFKGIIGETIAYREKNNVVRNDVLDFMLQLKKKMNDFTIDDITAHCLSFYIEGFETSSAVLNYVLFDVANNPNVCQRLRDEIDDIVANADDGIVTYEAVQKIKYLDCIISETLRIHSFASGMIKVCTSPTTFPHHAGPDAGPPLAIEVGTSIIIPIHVFHLDEKYFPEPDKYDPERFSDERKDEIKKFTYFPFGEGPRQCLGTRYALEQIKVAVIAVVRNFDLIVNERTRLPFEIDPQRLLALPKGGIWVNFVPRKTKRNTVNDQRG